MSYESFEVLNDVDMRGMSGFCMPRVICVILNLLTLNPRRRKRGGGWVYPCMDYVSIFINKNSNYNKINQFYCIKMYLHNPYTLQNPAVKVVGSVSWSWRVKF